MTPIPQSFGLPSAAQLGFVVRDMDASLKVYAPLFGPMHLVEFENHDFDYRGGKANCELRVAYGWTGEVEPFPARRQAVPDRAARSVDVDRGLGWFGTGQRRPKTSAAHGGCDSRLVRRRRLDGCFRHVPQPRLGCDLGVALGDVVAVAE